MRKIISLLFVLSFAIIHTFSAYAIAPPYVSGVEIAGNDTINLYVGDRITLEATASPEGVDFAYILWACSAENIIEITGDDGTTRLEPPVSKAKVKALSPGSVTVRVYADLWEPYPDEVTANDSVTVNVVSGMPATQNRLMCGVYDTNGEKNMRRMLIYASFIPKKNRMWNWCNRLFLPRLKFVKISSPTLTQMTIL